MFLKFITYFVAFFIIFVASWMQKNFLFCPLEQVYFQAVVFSGNLEGVPPVLISSFIEECIIVALNFSLVAMILERLYSKIKYLRLHICLLIYSLICFNQAFSIYSYIKGQIQNKEIATNYIPVERIRYTLNNPKNLILLYLESTEDTYRDKQIFTKNLLQPIDDLKGVSFDKYKQIPGTGWTVAAIFATQCGLPIKTTYLKDNYTCLSDILDSKGYYNVFMGGTSLEFTKKGEFFRNHKYHELYGREEWVEMGMTNLSDWGLYDEDLFAQAKLRLEALHKNKQPFNLTILTGDTHSPEGYISNFCRERGAKTLEDIVECSSIQVADFVSFVESNGYLDDTNIVIIGDHLFPFDAKFQNKSRSERYIYNRFISKKLPTKNREEIYHFDLLPTILSFIGISADSEYVAQGKDGFLNNRK